MTMLLQWLWQGSAIACALWVGLRCAPRINAATRYALWWVALLVVLLFPFVTHLTMLGSASMMPASPVGVDPGSLASDAWRVANPLVELPAPPDWLIACGMGAWLGSVLLGLGRLRRGVVTVRQLKQRSHRVAVAVERSLSLRRQWRRAGRRHAALRVSSSVSGACALGLFGRPVIVVSDRLVTTLDADDLDLIILHEQVHLARYDDWATLLQSCVSVFVGWHPAVRVITAALNVEREAACDEAVAARIGSVVRYATCLADAADVIAARRLSPAQAMAPHAAGTGSLLVRVQRLLDPRVQRRATLQRVTLASGVAGLAAASVVAVAVGPIIGAEAPSGPLAWRSAANMAVTPADGPEAARFTRVEVTATPDETFVVDHRPSVVPSGPRARVARAVSLSIEPPPSSTVTASTQSARVEDAPLTANGAASEPAPVLIQARAFTGSPVVFAGAASDAKPHRWAAVGRQVAREGATVGQQLAQRSTTLGQQMARRSSALGSFFGRAGKAVAGRF